MSRDPSRPQASWDIEKGDYYYKPGSHSSQRAEKVERDYQGNTTITFSDGSTQTVSKYRDAEFDTWDES